jgi:hypothetical protein
MKNTVRVRLKLLKIARARDTDTCIFCGSSNVTREHVFSRWTHKYMLPRTGKATSVIGVQYEDRIETAEFLMSGAMRDWKIKCVCGGDSTTCNNGWMRDLEVSAAPIMTPLILEQRTTLSESDQKIIATWAILKVMVAHHKIVHHMRRKQMRAVPAPTNGWSVWIGNYKRDALKLEWWSRPFPVLPDTVYTKRLSKQAAPNCIATTQIIKNLFIHVVYCPMEDFGTRWRFATPQGGPLSGNLLRIWPPSGIRYLWPQKALSDLDAKTAADAVLVGVLHIARIIREAASRMP